jgi:hypothetical protein
MAAISDRNKRVVVFFLLRKRPQFGKDDRQIFRHRRMNVHGALDDRIRRLRIHHVQQNVNYFIASDFKNRCTIALAADQHVAD